jgi:hypothetical protein
MIQKPSIEPELSYIVPLYIQNPDSTALADLIATYSKYSAAVLAKIQFIFVDDCSPVPIKVPPSNLNIVLARITNDIKWNQPGARNLGVQLSKTAKIVLTDLDHLFTEALFKKMIMSREPKHLNKFKRKNNGIAVKAHPNTFFCSKSVFYKSLGYDEAFSGNYGYDDIFFLEMQKALGTKLRYFSYLHAIIHVEHKNAGIPQQHFLPRDTAVNEKLLQHKLALIKSGQIFDSPQRMHINFPYQMIHP